MNQVIRIIFDDTFSKYDVRKAGELIIHYYGDVAAIEVYEEEFTDEENKDGEEQWQGTK